MQLAVDVQVVAKLFGVLWILGVFKMLRLTRVEYLAYSILTVSFKGDRVTKSARYHFAENSVFNAIVQEDWTSFHVKQVR